MSRAPLPRDDRPSGLPFMRLTSSRQYVTIASELAFYEGHWLPSQRRSVRCCGHECSFCDAGAERRVFCYVAVVREDQGLCLLELPRRCRELSDDLYLRASAAVGLGLVVWKDGTASNSPVMAVLTGEIEEVIPTDIWPLVSRFGLPPNPVREIPVARQRGMA